MNDLNERKAIADYFGTLISKGLSRQEAIQATAQATQKSIDYTEDICSMRG